MFHIEKFLPTECPKCRHRFQSEAEDWVRLFGDIVDGKKKIRETNGYLIIHCRHCDNMTAMFPLETYQLSDRKLAEEKMAKEGFVNLQVVTAVGNMAQNLHTVIAKPAIQVHAVTVDE
jgi:ribosomal protein S27E